MQSEENSAIECRRSFLHHVGCGFAGVAATALAASGIAPRISSSAFAADQGTLPLARAKRVIFLFMQGGISQVDSFDYKPLLAQRDGESMPFDDARVIANTGERGSNQRVMKSPWEFRRHGESGRFVSSLFPEIAKQVDDLCFIHSMHTDGVAHGPATLFMHCGSTNSVRPSLGSWLLYGMGSENSDLPGFITIAPSIGNGGPRNYGSAFLPAKYQGTPIGRAGTGETDLTIRDLNHPKLDRSIQKSQLDFIQAMNQSQLDRRRGGSDFEATIGSYDLAWRMQASAPQVLDLGQETKETEQLYGLDQPHTAAFGKKCLLARRLCEAGVRFVQVNYGDNSANPGWDQHTNLPKHADHAKAVDLPVSGLLTDLKRRGLLEDTIVWWCGEFGRTPYAEKNGTGRDHNPGGFTTWLAGGGFKPGFAYGETDEFGHHAIQGKVHMHDLHATLLHMLGIDHKQLTYRYAGRDYRLTDVYGHLVPAVMA